MVVRAMYMNGGPTEGYWYVGIKGTFLIACLQGHPDFPYRFKDSDPKAKRKAQQLAARINKILKKEK